MHVALPTVSDNRLGEVSSLVRFDIDAQGAVDFQPETTESASAKKQKNRGDSHGSIIHLPLSPRGLIPLQPLRLQIRQPLLEHIQLTLQPLALNL